MEKLIKRIEKIEERNKRVELDKAWEVSLERRLLIVIFTYVSIAVYMWFIEVDKPLLYAIIPSIGFTLSTLSLPLFKEIWLHRQRKGN